MYSNNTAAATTIIGESSFSDSLSIADGFSDSKKKILWYIKVMQQAGLEELSNVLKISRMAVHKHLNILLNKGFVEPIHIREGNVGRPKIFYQLTRNSKSILQDRIVLLHLLLSIILKREWEKKVSWTY